MRLSVMSLAMPLSRVLRCCHLTRFMHSFNQQRRVVTPVTLLHAHIHDQYELTHKG